MRFTKAFAVAALATAVLAPCAQAARAPRIDVLSSRAGSGRVLPRAVLRERGFVVADNLLPQKARILAMLALTRSEDPVEVQRMFDQY